MMDDLINQSFKDYQESEPVDGGGFLVESMNKCIDEAHQLPPLVSLYPDMVLEGDLSIIFGQSGIGKTIFAMQIARYIAEHDKRVLYVDCEMTPRQLGNRYKTANFPPTFLRAEMDRENPAEDVLKGIEEVAVANHVDVVFIDNITALGQSLDRSYGNLGFISRGFGTEQEHLSTESGNDRNELIARMKELSAKGMTQTAIAELLKTSQSKVSRLLKEQS